MRPRLRCEGEAFAYARVGNSPSYGGRGRRIASAGGTRIPMLILLAWDSATLILQ